MDVKTLAGITLCSGDISTAKWPEKAYDTRKTVSTNIDRCIKKKEILIKTVKETEEMEMWRLYGELITANIYAVKKGINTFRTYNF